MARQNEMGLFGVNGITHQHEAFLERLSLEREKKRADASAVDQRTSATTRRRRIASDHAAAVTAPEPVIGGGEITHVTETITPETAARYLESNLGNRKMRAHKIKQFASDMKNGRWMLTHQGIAFFDDGGLMDGQHRLAAVVESGVPVRMVVMRGFGRIVAHAIDSGTKRNEVDAERLNGIVVTPKEVACARAMLIMKQLKDVPDQEITAFRKRYQDYIRFGVSCVTTGRCRNSLVHAVITRAAFNGIDAAALTRFGDILAGCMPVEGEQAAYRVKTYVDNNKPCLSLVTDRQSTYLKIEGGLRAFLERRSPEFLREAGRELFPIPEDNCEYGTVTPKEG